MRQFFPESSDISVENPSIPENFALSYSIKFSLHMNNLLHANCY